MVFECIRTDLASSERYCSKHCRIEAGNDKPINCPIWFENNCNWQSAKNTEQQVQPDKFQEHCTHPSNYIICGAYSDGICKSPKGTCRLT